MLPVFLGHNLEGNGREHPPPLDSRVRIFGIDPQFTKFAVFCRPSGQMLMHLLIEIGSVRECEPRCSSAGQLTDEAKNYWKREEFLKRVITREKNAKASLDLPTAVLLTVCRFDFDLWY